MAKDIPYLEPAEECEEIFYDDCQEVGGKIKEISHSLKKDWIVKPKAELGSYYWDRWSSSNRL